ncbi:hypothetical protein HDU86_008204 [Geranomyces michiganensis]|nr:hypothetical protein HDU86_008204 [Geranomyces michiganensis]
MSTSPVRSTHWKAVDESVRHVQLIDALRSHDSEAIINAVKNLPPHAADAPAPAYGSPLHLAISLCPTPVIENLIAAAPSEAAAWANTQSARDGESALHLASKLGRADIVEILFKIEGLSDHLRDGRGCTADQVAASDRVKQLIVDHRNEFAADVIAKVRNALTNGPAQAAIDAFELDPRAQAYLKLGWIGINDPINADTEQSFLHFAARSDNLMLVDWALENGADPAVKDRKGRKPSDNSRTKHKLKTAIPQAPIISGSLPQATSSTLGTQPSAAPSQRGVLLKWTNYTSGYKSRYFVLENGSLSYYKSATDYPLACRGSVSTMIANVAMPDASDKSRFDVIGRGSAKYSLKARSPADAKKWVWALMESKKFMVDGAKEGATSSTHISVAESGDWGSGDEAEDNVLQERAMDATEMATTADGNAFKNTTAGGEALALRPPGVNISGAQPVFQAAEDDLALMVNLLNVQMATQQQVIHTLVTALAGSRTGSAVNDIPVALQNSSRGVEETVQRLVQRCVARERLWARRLKKERESRLRWEEVVKKVLKDEEANPDAPPSTSGFESSELKDSDLYTAGSMVSDEDFEDEEEENDDVFYDALDAQGAGALTLQRMSHSTTSMPPLPPARELTTASISLTAGARYLVDPRALKQSAVGYPGAGEHRTAIPLDLSKPKPSLAVWSFLKSAIGKDLSKITLPVFFNEPLSMLQRMCEDIEYVELLSLASAVGRGSEPGSAPPSEAAKTAAANIGANLADLTALQDEEASLVRLAYVAAYAMSNYSSTLGRIQKPFNPVLGETYELVRDDKGFRYLSEQVCHHPPISACHCESPDYTFWTEVSVKSKFWGKSLEIHPLGLCHVRLPVYKPGSSDIVETEHYSWKKVTTVVNNVIVGKLWMDHYGDMIVKNWRTGEECIVTFKPKPTGGWFGMSGGSKGSKGKPEEEDNGGGEIGGVVKDAKGVVRYELRGRWDGQVVADPVNRGGGRGSPLPLWKRNPMPPNAADNFFFTSFAITLNQLPDPLRASLPPTDSRLRPDQQAMERGDWDQANTLKERLELQQRDRRRELQANYDRTRTPSGPPARGIEMGEKWWSPRWFVRELDPDSREEHWRFDEEYWKRRNPPGGNKPDWPEWVFDIFADGETGKMP